MRMARSLILQEFKYQNNPIRTIWKNDEAWFVSKDVCAVLGIENNRDAVKSLEAEEVMTVANTYSHSGSRGGARSFIVVSESGLYALIFKSRKEEARAFRVWVTKEVLPAIRKTGSYKAEPSKQQKTNGLGASRYPFFNRPDCAIVLAELNKAGSAGLLNAEGFSRIVFETSGNGWKGLLARPILEQFITANLSLSVGGYEPISSVHARYIECTGDEITKNKLTRYLVARHPVISVKQKKLDGYPAQVYLNVKLTPEPIKIEHISDGETLAIATTQGGNK
jgi:prophage antirepressor-like protein